jgi:hypothetical protein
MATVVKRAIASVPGRSADETWRVIVDLLAPKGPAREELLSVAGVATSIIANMAPKDSAIVATCEGPRTRIYCIYDDDAFDADNVNETKLPHDALSGDWAVSLPCQAEDLAWVQAALKRSSTRLTARDASQKLSEDDSTGKASASTDFVVDLQGVFGS